MFRQNIPIHPVPSDCCRLEPSGSFSLRSTTVMLSKPRKPPSNTLLPSRSTLFTHHVKLISNLWKHCSRNFRSAFPARMRSMLYTRHTAQACTGGVMSQNPPSHARNWPFGGWDYLQQKKQRLL